MPQLTSAALFERDGRALVAHRRMPPFAGQWVLPLVAVREDEAAEDALRRHLREQFDLASAHEAFVETVYIVDPDDQAQYVANIFRVPLLADRMRFNAAGDYDDARWLAAGELADLWMPADLRAPLAQILTQPEALHETDWSGVGVAAVATGQALPLAEREAPPPAPPPDNRAGWDAIAASYQARYYGDRDVGRLKWSWGVFEDQLRLLDDVRGKRALVIGCGGGQDCVALERMGATAVGLDVSEQQLAYARKYAARHAAQNVSFVQGTAEDLSRFDDASFDLAVSIHALGYVERADRAVAEAARVLKPGGVLAVAVSHPFDQTLSDDPPYCVARSYWGGDIDWEWTFEDAHGRFRDYRRTVAEWFAAFTDAGFVVERLVEPYQGDAEDDAMRGIAIERARVLPYVLILKGRKR
jgi:SAM-dependent methyltransferase/ADP-ribose pyrophosphatase YjhB (NUDIX family)